MDSILVIVAKVEGSGPRESGACMRVTLESVDDTIGGGHLEWQAIALARDMLRDGRERHAERYALGPSLGQCCGGVVYLDFVRNGVMPVRPAPNHLVLFGAGHVGAALVRALAPLPCTITWVDEREDLFPASVPANVVCEATDTPEAIVEQAPPHADFLVMTHSHALDQRLALAILALPELAWFGLIGSDTKRVQFERRLRARGASEQRIAAMACPIGLPGIAGKQPAVIAASVAAQLLQLWEARAAGAKPLRLVASRHT